MNQTTETIPSNPEGRRTQSPLRSYLLMLAVVILAGAALSVALVNWTERQHFDTLVRQGTERLDLYASTVEAARQRFDYLPYIMSRDQQVTALLKGQLEANAVNRKLESWQLESQAAVLYLMDNRGQVLASSNWASTESFVGNNYHFRPYFLDALAGGKGQFFAIGVSTGQPGLFLSRPVMEQQQVIGVAVVKIDMTQLENDWRSGGELILISDSAGVIFLASDPEWKYRSLEPLKEETIQQLTQARKYSNNVIAPLPIVRRDQSPLGEPIIELSGPTSHSRDRISYLMHQRQLTHLDWTLHYLTDLKPLVFKRQSALLIAALSTLLLALLGFIFINRSQSRRLLELRVEKRTQDLNQTNRQLLREIDSRIEAEEQLRQTHEELIQAEKLAALGQMSAGIVHEINQPLSAMQTFVASTRLMLSRDDRDGAISNLDDISSMIRRVTAIVSHLKNFASKSKGHAAAVDLYKVINNALLLLGPRLEKSDVILSIEKSASAVYVIADEIKLEQILINLIRNALDAMSQPLTGEKHRLKIWCDSDAQRTSVYISDTGAGIDPDHLPKLFDPFFTTKPTGEGLGLGLSVSYGIAREFGGDLQVIEQPTQGTLFKLTLDTAKSNTIMQKKEVSIE